MMTISLLSDKDHINLVGLNDLVVGWRYLATNSKGAEALVLRTSSSGSPIVLYVYASGGDQLECGCELEEAQSYTYQLVFTEVKASIYKGA